VARERVRDHDDAAIAVALRGDDRAAMEALYGRFGGSVFAYLVGTIGDRAAAEDVHQQVFTELWQRRADYDPGRAGLFTWVMMVARSRAVDHLRRAVPEPREPQVAEALADGADDTEPIDELVERWRVAGLLARIPSEEATVLRMRFYDGLTQREIAERTAIPLGTVKMRMIQALERLRTLIEEEAA
jgi:RNA polymerase sigma-70 factor (ECF subfamily)